ncbi:MAG TPA: RcpC/CpaB family pilus assembly protein [Actinomycetota bacterium]|nr:RcpC/CpaB family pilus assembly protein [Actinomycetota bacterium]
MKRGGLMGLVIAGVLAVVATLAVLAYVRGVEESSGGTGPRVEVIVAKEDILAGANLDELIQSGAFTTELVPEDALVDEAVTSLSQLEGRSASAAILAGEQVTLARIQGTDVALPGGALGIPEGFQAVTLPLEASRVVGGAVVRGDRVTVYATFDKTDTTVTLVPEAQVLRVNEPAGDGGLGGGAGAETLITLALSAEDAQKAVFAFEQGSVWLGLLPPGQSGVQRPPVNVAAVLR